MKYYIKILTIIIFISSGVIAPAQTISDSGYRTVGHIKDDGTIQNESYRTIGHINDDGTVLDASYRTIGHARNIPTDWAAVFFFFM